MTETNYCKCEKPKEPIPDMGEPLGGFEFHHNVCGKCGLPIPSPVETAHICDPETYVVMAGRGWCAQCPEILAANETGNDEASIQEAMKEQFTAETAPEKEWPTDISDDFLVQAGILPNKEWATPDPKELSWQEDLRLKVGFDKNQDREVCILFIERMMQEATLAERNRIIALVEGMRKEEAPFDPSEVIDGVERTVRVYKMAHNIALNDLLSALSKSA